MTLLVVPAHRPGHPERPAQRWSVRLCRVDAGVLWLNLLLLLGWCSSPS
jgi:hypothetical protein